MDILNLIFKSFWHFIGTTILLALILEGLAEIVKLICKQKSENEPKT